MNNIDHNLFNEESFVEERVTMMEFDLHKVVACIQTNGAALEDGQLLSKVKIIVSNWSDLNVGLFNKNLGVFEAVEPSLEKRLVKIVEFYISEGKLKLVGFGPGLNGGWVEWEFMKPKVTIQGDIE